MRLDHPSDRLRALAEKVIAGERLTDEELDDAFDEAGVSTEAQLRALALARRWVKEPKPLSLDAEAGSYTEDDLGFSLDPCTSAQRAYLEAFDRWLRSGDDRTLRAKDNALELVMIEAQDRRERGEFPELDEQDRLDAIEAAEAINDVMEDRDDFRRAA